MVWSKKDLEKLRDKWKVTRPDLYERIIQLDFDGELEGLVLPEVVN